MSNMLENLGSVSNALHRGDYENALFLLIGLKKSDEIQREIVQAQIDQIKIGQFDSVTVWVDTFINQHSDPELSELSDFLDSEEISIEIDSSLAGFDISESDFGDGIDFFEDFEDLNVSDLTENSSTKKEKLKAKLAGLRAQSEEDVSLFPGNHDFDALIKGASKSENEDPFDELMETSSSNSGMNSSMVNYGMASKSSSSTKEVDSTRNVGETRQRNSTPLAPASIDRLGFGELDVESEDISARQYRGEPRLAETSDSDSEAQFGRSRETANRNAAKSFIVEEPSRPVTNLGAIRLEAVRLLESGEFDAALDITKKILSRSDDVQTQELQHTILEKIEERNLLMIGNLSHTPRLLITLDKLSNYALDHRAGFLASIIDGLSTYEDLIDISGLPRESALEIIAVLIKQKIIA